MELRKRWEARTQATPSMADPSPLGSGPLNRHGMPRLPVGQSASKKWPVLDLGVLPEVTRESFRLEIDGAVEVPITLGFHQLLELEQVEDVSDFHCVTTWSKFDLAWKGVRVSDLLALARPLENACAVMAHASDQYTTNVVLEEALKPGSSFTSISDQDLPQALAGLASPYRVIRRHAACVLNNRWLGAAAQARAIQGLLQALQDEDEKVRYLAQLGLEGLRHS